MAAGERSAGNHASLEAQLREVRAERDAARLELASVKHQLAEALNREQAAITRERMRMTAFQFRIPTFPAAQLPPGPRGTVLPPAPGRPGLPTPSET